MGLPGIIGASGLIGRRTALDPNAFALDGFDNTPLAAIHVGLCLKEAYVGEPLVSVLNAANQLEHFPSLATGKPDVQAILDHCAGGSGRAVRAYEHVNGLYLEAPDASAAPLCVVAGEPVLGANGYLALRWDGTADPNSGNDRLQRADSFGLSGAPAITVAGDLGAGATGYSIWFQLGDTTNPAAGKAFEVFGYFHPDNTNWFYLEPGMGVGTWREGYLSGDPRQLPSWAQLSVAAGAPALNMSARFAGAALALTGGGNTSQVLALDNDGFSWGGTGFGVAGAMSAPTSNIFVWGLDALGDDQARFDALESAVRA